MTQITLLSFLAFSRCYHILPPSSLYLTLVLQGIFDKQRVRQEVESMVADLQLVGKSKIQSARLSGGMKRKLR